MRSFLICVIFHLLFSDGILPRSGKLYQPEDLDWRDTELNDFEELIGEPFFDPFLEKESSSSEDFEEEAVGDLEISMDTRTSHIMDKDDPVEYAVGDFLPTAKEDSSSEEAPELDDEDMGRLYDDSEEVELAMAVEDTEEAVGSDPELDELVKLFLDDSEEDIEEEVPVALYVGDSDEDSVESWDDSEEDSVGSSESIDSESLEDDLESLEDHIESLDDISSDESEVGSESLEYASEDYSSEEAVGSEDWEDLFDTESLEDDMESLEDHLDSWEDALNDESAVGSESWEDELDSEDYSEDEVGSEIWEDDSEELDSDDSWDYSEDAIGSAESWEDDSEDELLDSEDEVGSESWEDDSEDELDSDDSWDYSEDEVGSESWEDDSEDDSVENWDDSEDAVSSKDDSSDIEFMKNLLRDDYFEDDVDFDMLDSSEEEVGDFIELPVGDFVDDSVDYSDEEFSDSSEEMVGDFLSEEYDSSDLLPDSVLAQSSSMDDSSWDSQEEELVGSGMPQGLFAMDEDGLDSEEFAVGETPDYMLDSGDASEEDSYNRDDYADSLDSSDSALDEMELGDSDDEVALGSPYQYVDELFSDEESVSGDELSLYDSEEEVPVGMLDANGWAILDAPPYTKAKNYESRRRQRRDADGWDREDYDQEPVSEDEEGYDYDLSDEERSYRRRRRRPHARRGKLQRQYRPRRQHPRERVTTFLEEEAVGSAEEMLDQIDQITSNLDWLSEDDFEDLRRRLQSKSEDDDDGFGKDMTLEDHIHAIHNLHQVHKRLMELKHKHELEEQKKSLETKSEDSSSADDSKGPMLIAHAHHIPLDAKAQMTRIESKGSDADAIHKELHDFIMGDHDALESKSDELSTLRKQLEDYKQKLAGKQNLEKQNEELKAKLMAMNDVDKAKDQEEQRKIEEAKRQKAEAEKRKKEEEKREKAEKQKELERKKEEASRKIKEMKEKIRLRKQQKLQEARDELVKRLRDELSELKEKAAYRKKMREEKQKEENKKKEASEKRKEEKKREQKEEEEKNKLTEDKKKALIKKVKEEKERRKKEALKESKEDTEDSQARQLARQRLQDKHLRELYRHKHADFHLDRIANQFPFIRHFFGHTGDLQEECGETKCRCGFYKINWRYKNHCYVVDGDCQKCDAEDSKKVKAIGFTYRYVEQVKKRLPIFTYRRQGKQWHNEPKEKSVCPKGKVVTGVRTMVTKTADKHKHSMKIKCGPGNGKGLTKEDLKQQMQDVKKQDEAAKKSYEKDEEDAQKKPEKDGKAEEDDPTKCLSKGKSCQCGFTSVTFNQAANGCFIPDGECNVCGSTKIGAAIQGIGFEYVYNDAAKKEFPKFVVRKKGAEWKDPKKQFQCKEGYVVNGVWTSAEKDVEASAEGGKKVKRDQYYLSITCRKAEYSEEEKKGPKESAADEEKQDKKEEAEENSDDNSSSDASEDDGPVKQHECPPAVSECKCGFSFVAWRKTEDCYQLQGECLECGTPGAVNAIGYNYKFDKERKKSVYRWRYRTEGKLWAQPERRYTCREGKIVTNIATSAVRSGDEVKYHLWMKCNDAIPTTPKVALNGMVSWFKYAGWDGKVWHSTVGNFTMSVLGGEISTKIERGDGAENGVWQVQGTTATQVGFGEIIPRDYTVCTLSRYTGPENQRRILIGTGGNWLHGHWSGQAGVAIYGTWVTRSVNRVTPATNWLFMCGQNAQRSIIRANGISIKKANGGIKGPMSMQINKGGCCEKESSNWAVAEIMTWDRYLTFTELVHVEAYLRRVLKAGNLDQKPQTTAEVAVFMSQPALTPIPLKQEAVASVSTTKRALSLKNAPKAKPKPNVIGFNQPIHFDVERNIQEAVSEAFENIGIDSAIDDNVEVALAESEVAPRHSRSAAQRTEASIMRTQLGLAKVGGIFNLNVILLALLIFGVVTIAVSCVYFSKPQGDAVDAYYDSLANELHALE